jgi:UDP-GlcNAc:undecaprenyl-phosphate GlcNAc-1-phosphate transferase
MRALPFALALLFAAALGRPVLRLLTGAGAVRPNFRGRALPCPLGVLPLLAGLVALGVLLAFSRLAREPVFYPQTGRVVLFALGAFALGLLDDALGRGEEPDAPRGLRGHGRALREGRLTSGTVKALALPGVALAVGTPFALTTWRWLLAAAVLVLSTHAFNLLDLRPGRAIKALVLVGAGLTTGTQDVKPLWAVGLFAGPALVAGAYDVRERAMLGDSGAGLLGAVAGMWIVLALGASGQLVALALLLAVGAYGEIRSLSAVIDRTPGLRQLDSWGRPS